MKEVKSAIAKGESLKISYKMKKCWCGWWWRRQSLWCFTYTITDPNHTTQLGQSATFNKGDLVDLAFPIVNQDGPVYTKVQASAIVDTHDWEILVNYDASGVDFGQAYRVIYNARVDNAKLASFNVYFQWNGFGKPGSQPWGFTNSGSSSQHDELGQTLPA